MIYLYCPINFFSLLEESQVLLYRHFIHTVINCLNGLDICSKELIPSGMGIIISQEMNLSI